MSDLAGRHEAGGSRDFQAQQLIRDQPIRTLPPWQTGRTPAIIIAWQFAIERDLLRLTNEERAKAGLSPVVSDARLQSVARSHSHDQAVNNYSAHLSLDGKSPADRLRGAGIAYNWEGENIRWVSSREASTVARDMMYDGPFGWMNSAEHKANILNPRFTHVGIGVFRSSTNGRFIATQNFIQKP